MSISKYEKKVKAVKSLVELEELDGLIPTLKQLIFEKEDLKARYGSLSEEDKFLFFGQLASKVGEHFLSLTVAMVPVSIAIDAIKQQESINEILTDFIQHEALLISSLALVSEVSSLLKDSSKQRRIKHKFNEIEDVFNALRGELNTIKELVIDKLEGYDKVQQPSEIQEKISNPGFGRFVSELKELGESNTPKATVDDLKTLKSLDNLLKKDKTVDVLKKLEAKTLPQLLTEQAIVRLNLKKRVLSLADLYQVEIENRIALVPDTEKPPIKQIILAEQQFQNINASRPMLDTIGRMNDTRGIILTGVAITAICVVGAGLLVATALPIVTALSVVGVVTSATAAIMAMSKRAFNKKTERLERNLAVSEALVEDIFITTAKSELNHLDKLDLPSDLKNTFNLEALFKKDENTGKSSIDPLKELIAEAYEKVSGEKNSTDLAKYICAMHDLFYGNGSADKFDDKSPAEQLAAMQAINRSLLKDAKKWSAFSLRQHWLFRAVDKLNTSEPKEWGKIISEAKNENKILNTQHFWARGKPPVLNFVTSIVNNVDDAFSHQAYFKTYDKYTDLERAAVNAELSTIFAGILATALSGISTAASGVSNIIVGLEAQKSLVDIGKSVGEAAGRACPFLILAGICMLTVKGFQERREYSAKDLELQNLDALKTKLDKEFNNLVGPKSSSSKNPFQIKLGSMLGDDFTQDIQELFTDDIDDIQDQYKSLYKSKVKETGKNLYQEGPEFTIEYLLGEKSNKSFADLIHEQAYARFHGGDKLLTTADVYQVAIERKIESVLADFDAEERYTYETGLRQAIIFKQHMANYDVYQPVLKSLNNQRLARTWAAFTLAGAGTAALAITLACGLPLVLAATPILPVIVTCIGIGTAIATIALAFHKRRLDKNAKKIKTDHEPFKDSMKEFFDQLHTEGSDVDHQLNGPLASSPFSKVSDRDYDAVALELEGIISAYLEDRPQKAAGVKRDFSDYLHETLNTIGEAEEITSRVWLHAIFKSYKDYRNSLNSMDKIFKVSSLDKLFKSLDMNDPKASLEKLKAHQKEKIINKGMSRFVEINMTNTLLDIIKNSSADSDKSKESLINRLKEVVEDFNNNSSPREQLVAIFKEYRDHRDDLDEFKQNSPLDKLFKSLDLSNPLECLQTLQDYQKKISTENTTEVYQEVYQDSVDYDEEQRHSVSLSFGY